MPQPGVVLATATEPLVVSEDGNTTASFTIALETVPLSAVSVTFLSRFDGLACNPASVNFDYTNYEVPVTVSVSGVDDFVDQGFSHGDAVSFVVASADSLEECLEANRPACGQAAKYANFSTSQGPGTKGGAVLLNATVLDNDAAGLILSTHALNATYDNFGDPLDHGDYTISLASKPTGPVSIDVGGLGPFSNATPQFLTIEPEAWSTSVPIFINAGAPSKNRPVCSNGKRFCSLIATGRIENVTHAVRSNDPFYGALTTAAETVRVSINVVYDATNPPAVVSTAFTNVLNSINIAFNMQARLVLAGSSNGVSSSFDCSIVLTLSAVEVSHYFGAGAYCTFASPSSILQVNFGTAARVVPLNRFALRPLAISSAAVGASLRTINESFVIGIPAQPTAPSVELAASSTTVGVCDNLLLDGSSSYGSGGRSMAFKWSVVMENGYAVENISLPFQMASDAMGGMGAQSVMVPSSAMVQGSIFTVTLEATNFLGLVDSKSVTISKLAVPAPVISIQGADSVVSTHSSKLQLMATASLPEMSCVVTDLSNAKMDFFWDETTGQFQGPLAATSKNPRVFVALPGTLKTGLTYTFRILGRMSDSPSVNNSASVTVVVVPQPVEARIKGGAHRQIGLDLDFNLDGSSSYDADADSTPFTYGWTCEAASIGADCRNLSFANFSVPKLEVPSTTLPVGYYLFSLFAAKGSRNDTATTTVEVTPGAPPAIQIAKFNPEANSFAYLSASVTSSLSFSTIWTAEDGGVSAPFLVNRAAASTVSNKLSAVVLLFVLTPGSTYTFRFTVRNV